MKYCVLFPFGSLACSLALLTGPAHAQGGPKHCSFTAEFAEEACLRDVKADYWNELAICKNIEDRRDRIECREEAEAERIEGIRSGDESCRKQREARAEVCDLLGQDRYDPDWDPDNFVDPDDIGDTVAANPWLSLVPGFTQVVTAGEDGEEWVLQYVTEDTEEIDGVICRTVVDLEFAPDEPDDEEEEDGSGRLERSHDIVIDNVELEITEYTDDWYAQDIDGNIWYCGELSREYEDGDIADLDGSFRQGEDVDKAGLLMPAIPIVGDAFRQEWSVNNAEDYAVVVSTAGGPDEEVEGFECNDSCLVTRERTPLEPDIEELKYWLMNTGFVLAAEPDQDGEREELICQGDALEDCVTDPDILDELCEIAPDAFCDDED